MMTNQTIHSDLAIPPGEYLEEVVRELGMTKDELAQRMNRPATKLSPIFKGEKAITPDTALQLEKVVGVPAHIWTGLEAEYRLALARQEEARQRERLSSEVPLVQRFCYRQLVSLGAISRKASAVEKVLELQRFFGVTSLHQVLGLRRYQAAFRCGNLSEKGRAPEAVAAWLRLGEVEAQRTQCGAFDKTRLGAALQELRALTLQPAEEWPAVLARVLKEAGVVFVLCPHLPGTKAHGATFWLGRDKAVLMMSVRGRWADIFWFSLFHEIGHLLFHRRDAVILEDGDSDPETEIREREADKFAADQLVPPDDYARFVQRQAFSASEIQQFARQTGVDSGIVVGRLQHDKHLPREWQNKLRSRLSMLHAREVR